MGKRGSGPEGPDREPEPFENETPEAALDNDNAGCDCSQPCLEALFDQYGKAFAGMDCSKIVYDSGWEDSEKVAIRVVLAAGPPNPELRRWVRRLALQSADPSEEVS